MIFFWSLVCQLIGYSAATFSDYPLLVHSGVSFLIALSLKFPRSWILLNALIPFLFLIPAINPIIPFAILVLLLIVFLPVLSTKAPLFLSNDLIIEAILEELPKEKEFIFIDLGCGTGKVIRKLSKAFPNGQFRGYELGIVPFMTAFVLSLFKRNVRIYFRSFWKIPWEDSNYLYAFLSPEPMDKVTQKYKSLPKRPVFLVNSFPLTIQHQKEVICGKQSLYIYETQN